MKYTIIFILLGGYCFAVAFVMGGVTWLLAWPGLDLLLLAGAYAGLGPGLFGKRADGRLPWWSVLLWLPYLWFTWGVWHLQRALTREPCANEVVPGLWIGRRPLVAELPASITLIVDLTAEFFVARGVVRGRSCLSLPTLDASIPDSVRFAEVVGHVARWPGGVYIHCALGHGRSALVAAAVLLSLGLAANVQEAEALIRQVRRGVRLRLSQRRALEQWWSTRKDVS